MSQRLQRTLVLASLLLAVSSCSSTPRSSHEPAVDGATDGKLHAAVSGPARTEKERARDVYRHPVETLEFFGLKDDMNVIELSPGGGWYTAVVAPVLREKGTFHVTSGDPDGPPASESTVFAKELASRFAKDPATFDKVQITRVKESGDLSLGPDGSADMVLVFRSVHNWVAANMLDSVTASIVRVLKSGGVLGIEAHRAQKGAPTDAQTADKSGYLPEDFVIQRMEAAGLKLAGRSEINANPKDDRNHPDGVWTLPPTFAQKDVDRAKYAAIGESDRMTLRFVKP